MAMRILRLRTADIRRLWADTALTLPQAAASLGISVDTLQDHAHRLGLGARRVGRMPAVKPADLPELRSMWILGVSSREIALHFGVSYTAVRNAALSMGLMPRGAGYRARLRLPDYREARVGAAMALQAKVQR